MQDIVIITDIGSVDPDDVLSLLLSLSLAQQNKDINIIGIIATHHYPTKRAQLVKLILTELKSDIKVYIGHGVEYGEFNQINRNQFIEDNKLFPTFFGYPKGVYLTEKEWFPQFMKGYYDNYDSNIIDSLQIEKESGHIFLTNLLKNYSSENKLKVICLGPMHDLAKIPVELYYNMVIYAMGGGFEKVNENNIIIPIAGYNWGTCPEVTSLVLQKLSQTGQTLTLISSAIVRNKNIVLPLEIYNKWLNRVISNDISIMVPKITKAIFADWIYCNKGNKLTQHKNLCDPLITYFGNI